METKSSYGNNIAFIFFLLIVLVFYSRFFNVIGVNYVILGRHYLYTSLFIAFFPFFIGKVNEHVMPLSKYVYFILLWPIITTLLFFLNGGSVEHEMSMTLSWTLLSILFFYFTNFNIKEETIISGLTIFAVLTSIIQIIQQFLPEYAIFGIIDPVSEEYGGEIATIRNGLYRFRVGNCFIQMFCFFYYWHLLMKKINVKTIILVAIFAISIYLYLTRQIMMSVIATCMISFILFRNIKSNMAIIIVVLFAILLYAYWDLLFARLISDYYDDTYTTDIRFAFLSWTHDFFQKNIFTFILGEGHSARIFNLIQRGFYVSDIGFIGTIFYFGILWPLVYFKLVYDLLVKYNRFIPDYIRSFVLASCLINLFIFSYTNALSMILWAIVIYISSLYINGGKIEV